MAKHKRARNCRKTAIVAGQIPGTKKWFQCCPGKTVPKCHIFDPIAAAKRGAAANKAAATRRTKKDTMFDVERLRAQHGSDWASGGTAGLGGYSKRRRRSRR